MVQRLQTVRRRQRGGALAEFAVVLPCLMLLMLLMGEGASVIDTYQVLQNAAREGARLAVTPGEQNLAGEVQTRVINYAASDGIALTSADVTVNQGLTVSQSGGGCSVAEPCLSASQVTVNYNYPLQYLPKLPFGIANTVKLGAAVEMRNFY